MNAELFMVFDVESIGLHGEGYAVGWVVIDRSGRSVASASYACDPDRANGSDAGREWVRQNAPIPRMGYNCSAPKWVREEFWRAWTYAKERGALLAADCAWPVEAHFLAQCVDDDPATREWGGPYPLIDISAVRLAAGLDPLGTEERRPDELPLHDPQADARQSARLLIEALDWIENKSISEGLVGA